MQRFDYAAIERRFDTILDALSSELSDSERREVQGFVKANEYGVALETLCALLVEENKRIPSAAFAELVTLADAMELRSTTITDEIQRRVIHR